jgi:hypothetical protein
MKTIQRVYPIRKSAKAWRIPILVTHVCNENCSYYLEREINEEGIWYIPKPNHEYKDGKCPRYGKIFRSDGVPLKNFDVNNPSAYEEPICNPDEIVINDTRFSVIIRYPLRDPVKISMFAPSDRGFSRKQLIDSLKHIYEFIYREEERTATPIVYEYREICTTCQADTVNIYLLNCKLVENCSICYNLGKKQGCSLPCGHKFHRKCVKGWVEQNNTCPLCRSYIKKCNSCNGLGFITHMRENVVIPIEERGFFYNRNTTDGIFGIWGHDFEDLVLEKLFYDHENKLLQIFIGS